jgi:hypothetical protein
MNIKKSRSDASWNQLSPEARQALETWLFEDRLSHEQAHARAQTELGYTGSIASLKRFYSYLARERIVAGFPDSTAHARKIERSHASTEELRNAGLKVMAQSFLQQVTESPQQVKQWGWLARLLLQSEENEIRRSFTVEHHALRRQSLQFARERFEYDVIEKAHKIWPMLRDLDQARNAPKRHKYAYSASVIAIKQLLFGVRSRANHPDGPEANAAIEAEADRILAQMEKREAAKQADTEEKG